MLGFYRTYTLPFKEKIPVFLEDYLACVPKYKRINRFFGRYLYTEIVLRKSQRVKQITSKHQRILWVQWVDSYLGDSLMDLSSRVLLKDKQIDLLTKENTAKIYQNDAIFNQVFTHSSQCNANNYDLIIIGSYRQRELKSLSKHILSIPHISLFGYYHVNDFSRLYFSFFRINQLLPSPHTEKYINKIAKPLLPISETDKAIVESYNLPQDFITVVIGGASKERIFHHWDKVVNRLIEDKITKNIVLIGLQNAQEIAKNITAQHPKIVINKVGECSFNQTAQIIKKSKMLVCCDGGLLHAANAVQTPFVGLFYSIEPMARLIKSNPSLVLFDKKNINNISVDDIIEKVKLLKNN